MSQCLTVIVGIAISDGSPPKLYANTKAGLHCPNGLKSPLGPTKFCTYRSVTLKNGDICSVGDWVLVRLDGAGPAVCRVDEILTPLSLNGQTPQCAGAVLLQRATLTEIAETYHMPKVYLECNEFFLQPPVVGA